MNLKKLFLPVDMTVGDPVRQIVTFTIPMLLGNIAQQILDYELDIVKLFNVA